jgi:hypothetical protein
MYPSTLALYLIGFFTTKQCAEPGFEKKISPLTEVLVNKVSSRFNQTVLEVIKDNTCSSADQVKVSKNHMNI